MEPGIHDYKTRLQEFSAQHFGIAPTYQVEAKGPDHDREFSALVRIEDQTFGPGAGTSKKNAEQEAARIACQTLTKEITSTSSSKTIGNRPTMLITAKITECR